jgi:hypothetical protein
MSRSLTIIIAHEGHGRAALYLSFADERGHGLFRLEGSYPDETSARELAQRMFYQQQIFPPVGIAKMPEPPREG